MTSDNPLTRLFGTPCRVVPEEATPEMLDAGTEAVHAPHAAQNGTNRELMPYIYEALLAAVPSHFLEIAQALERVVEAADHYVASREAAPVGNWEERCEEAGWQLAQTQRAYRAAREKGKAE